MKTYQIDIIPKVPLLSAGNAQNLAYDLQPAFDEFGFPLLHGKTIKGLIKESMLEVLEMQNLKSDDEIRAYLKNIFGEGSRDSDASGWLVVKNFYLPHYKTEIRAWLENTEVKPHHSRAFRDYFTIVISRTRLLYGIPKEKSLRTFSLLNPARVHKLTTDFHLIEEEIPNIEKALLNLRRVGIARSRGSGLVKVEANVIESLPVAENLESWVGGSNVLEVELRLLEPVINNSDSGDLFNVKSGDFFPGNKLLGLFASEYLKNNDATQPDFKDFFLSGSLYFDFLSKNGSVPIPDNIHFSKYDLLENGTRPIYNVFDKPEEAITKPIGGYHLNGAPVDVKKIRGFHSSRPIRTAGRSFKNDGNGDIFAYEALAPGQVFKGQIRGEEEILRKFFEQFSAKSEYRMGKAKFAQYGEVMISLKPKTILKKEIEAPKYLIIESPLILFDEFGMPSLTVSQIESELSGLTLNQDNAVLKELAIKGFRTDWGTQTDEIIAIKHGSVIEILSVSEKQNAVQYIGEYHSMGMGKIRLISADEFREIKSSLVNSTATDQSLNSFELFDEKSIQEMPHSLQGICNGINSSIQKDNEIFKAIELAYTDFNRNSTTSKLRNNRISVLLKALGSCNSLDDLKSYFEKDSAKGLKESGQELKDKKVFDLLERTQINHIEFSDFWIKYFRTIRKLKKQRNG
ncbi:RAMP superfamily CRISPR-associated protein [Jiulongibacter sediminis]|uniref:RAMP superfamily CRISPR-associated protein n=1 Tax=Jiulongibacter sediminis TaxID=1605367 RepID=UPI0026EAE4BC|nr:RAMP superfamily CRISPR-associated protein [Jiulongibacter sediminis]